ncbi:biotin--[acetyl-CoA-carboxylase] ligase [Calidifontibacter terrae]
MAPVLEADRLRAQIPTQPWNRVDIVPEVASTNAALMADPQPWSVFVADFQSAGRGRLDRGWQAPAGLGISLSVTLPLPSEPGRWGWVPLLVGLAVRRALLRATGLTAGLKWPNDLLLKIGDGQQRKVGGILCEVAPGTDPVVVAGIGINVWQNKDQLATDAATSLSLNGSQVWREDLIATVLEELVAIQARWDDPSSDDDYRSACVTLGQQVKVQVSHDQTCTGRAVDIDDLGRLVVDDGNERIPHSVGDIIHVRPDAASIRSQDRSAFVDQVEEQLMGSPRSLRRLDVAALAGTNSDLPRKFWRAMGFANARDEDVVFNQRDVEAVRRIERLISNGLLDEETAVRLARAVGRSTDRMQMWMLQLVSDMMTAEQDLELDTAIAFDVAERMIAISDEMTLLVDYVARRNLASAISKMVADAEPESHVGVVRTVGFADLVNFTSLVRTTSERDLAELVTTFETTVSDVVAQAGGAVVKTVGDEVLFTHRSIDGGIQIAFDLLEAVAASTKLPRLRIGVATGRVLARQGDVYGHTVNRASRLTSTAAPGEILVDAEVARVATAMATADVFEVGVVRLPGVGDVQAAAISRSIKKETR